MLVLAEFPAAPEETWDSIPRHARPLPPDPLHRHLCDRLPLLLGVSRREGAGPERRARDTRAREVRRAELLPGQPLGPVRVALLGHRGGGASHRARPRRAVRLRARDPERLAAHQVTPLDVQRAVAAQNIDLPSGRIEGADTELTIRTAGRLNTPEEFNRLILRQQGGRSIEFGDIGEAVLDAENLRTGMRILGVPMIGVNVLPQANANAVSIADEFYRRMKLLEKEIPKDIETTVGYDFTTFVRRTVKEVEDTVLIALGLVALIIFLFLRDWRSTLIPVIAIPVSIVSAFFIMYLAGFSINVLTLVAVLLSIGLVCDDAIVVLENIYSKVEEGQSPLAAALEGSREIYFAVISTTVTLAAVFVPIVFLEGLTGRLFREFGVVVAGSVLVSAFVALSLSPMMCRFMLRPHGQHGWFYRVTEPFFVALNRGYETSLSVFLQRRWLSLPIVAGSVAIIVWMGGQLPSELAPLEDRSNIRINIRAAEGATYEYTRDRVDELAKHIATTVPEIRHSTSGGGGLNMGPNTGLQNIYLVEPNERTRSQQAIFDQLSDEMNQFTGIRAFPSQPPTIGERRSAQPVQFVLKASRVETLVDVLPKFLEAAQDNPALRFVDTDLKINRPEVSVRINRAKAAELDIPVSDIGRTLQFAFGDSRLGYFLKDGKQYQVIGQLGRSDRNKPSDLKRVSVRARDGSMVSLDNLITYDETISPASIYRFNRNVSATISAQPAPGYTLGQALEELEKLARALPPTVSTDLAGQSRDFRDSAQSLVFAFGFALILIYLVLAAQFESFVDPAIILLTVPLSVAGAILSLWLTASTLNVFSQIGIIMLIGLVTKNGILIVEFANQRKRAGLSKLDAVHAAAVARLRPILMTSLAMILGALPIALALGSAAGSRKSMGVAVVGGLLFSGFLSLYVVPAAYAYLSRPVKQESAEETALLGAAAH
ncbi:MAG: efflux RND transporter permease subunit [Vicinamibacteria bacterium]|nr:efflux RND transporter permease subunit [Vicinamibacteria bacterium]